MTSFRTWPVLNGLLAFISLVWVAERVPAQQRQPASITMQTIEETGDGRASIDGGQRQDPKVWPATLKYNLNDQFSCTSTIIGERSIITAAHCLQDGAIADVRFPKDGKTVKLRCDHHPGYKRTGLLNDMALCLSDSAFPTRFTYENLDMRPARLAVGTELFLLGYGCRNVNDVGDPTKSGQLYGGTSKIDRIPTATNDHIETQGGVVICPGDSGGSAFVLASSIEGPRSIIGINSGYFAAPRVSAISVFSESTVAFVKKWSTDNNASICGVHPAAGNCRDRFAQ